VIVLVTTQKQFVSENKRKLMIDERLEELYKKAGYAGVNISKVPLGHQITIYAEKPGIIIGKKGSSIKDLSSLLEQDYKLENPQIEVKPVEVPELSAKVMAYRMRLYLERGLAHKRIVFSSLDSIMKAGAEGAEVSLRGKFTTERSRFIKLRKGQIHQSGEPAKLVDAAVTDVLLKPGIIGIKVKISKPNTYRPQIIARQLDPAAVSALQKTKQSTQTVVGEQVQAVAQPIELPVEENKES
jgi:small subunit ribosomal protein S3